MHVMQRQKQRYDIVRLLCPGGDERLNLCGDVAVGGHRPLGLAGGPTGKDNHRPSRWSELKGPLWLEGAVGVGGLRALTIDDGEVSGPSIDVSSSPFVKISLTFRPFFYWLVALGRLKPPGVQT